MKRPTVVMFCTVIIFFLTPLVSNEEPLDLLIVTHEWAPYNYMIEGEITGFSTDIVLSILQVMGKEYEIRFVPGMRTLYFLDNRPCTMMFSLFRIPEREERYKWIGPLKDASIYFYKRKDDPREFKTIEDVKNVSLIACRQEGVVPDKLQGLGFNNLDRTSVSSLPVYQKLLYGRCDLAISDTDLGVRHYLKTVSIKLDDVFEKIPIPIYEATLYIGCSKDIPDEVIREWQAALDTLKRNGTYDKIAEKYR